MELGEALGIDLVALWWTQRPWENLLVLTAPDSKCHMDWEGAQSLLVSAMRRDTVTAKLIDEPCHEAGDSACWLSVIEWSTQVISGLPQTLQQALLWIQTEVLSKSLLNQAYQALKLTGRSSCVPGAVMKQEARGDGQCCHYLWECSSVSSCLLWSAFSSFGVPSPGACDVGDAGCQGCDTAVLWHRLVQGRCGHSVRPQSPSPRQALLALTN